MPHRPETAPLDKDLVFIVSGGRTGTAFFGERLNLIIRGASAFHEPDLLDGISARSLQAIRRFGFYHMVVGRLLGATGIRLLTQDYLAGKVDHRAAVAAVLKQRQAFYQSQPTSLVIEAYYQWYGLLPVIRDAFPNAKVVAIVRDPRTWVASWLRFGGHHDEKDKVRSLGLPRLSPAMLGDRHYADQWDQMGPFERLCWDWNAIYDLIQRFNARDDLCRLFKFEELFAPNEHMAELLSWITEFGARRYELFPYDDLLGFRINASSDRARVDWRSWSPQRAASLQEICGPLMARYGYGQELEWQALLGRAQKATASPFALQAR